MAKGYLRFKDFKQRGLVNSWPQLKRLIEKHSFPPGRMAGVNTRIWTEDEVDDWVASRPVVGPDPRGAAKVNRDRTRKAATETTTATD